VWFSDKSFWQVVRGSKALRLFALFAVALASLCDVAAAQNVRQWNGTLALNRQPAQVFANTLALALLPSSNVNSTVTNWPGMIWRVRPTSCKNCPCPGTSST